MNTIISAIVALTVFSATANATDLATKIFDQQFVDGENVDNDAIRSGQTLHPKGIFGAE